MNGYSINDMPVGSSKNKQLYFDINVDETKDCESDSYADNIRSDKYTELAMQQIMEKYLGIKEKVMSESDTANESEYVAESEEEEEEEKLAETEAEEVESEELSSTEYESESSDNVKDLGYISNELIINRAMEAYKNEFGEYPSLDILKEGLSVAKAGLFNASDSEFEYDDADNEYECESVMEFSDELEDALLIASDIGSIHQIYLVNKILDTCYEVNDRESTLDELKRIFGKIKNELEVEAAEEILDLIEINDCDSYDGDYVVTKKDIAQGALDDNIDLEYESDDNDFSGESEEDLQDDDVDESDSNDDYNDEEDDDDSDYNPDYDEQNYQDDFELYQ